MKLNVFLGIVFVLLILANVYVRPDETKLNFEFLPEMVRTASYKAFDENENFANHMTFQHASAHGVAGHCPRRLWRERGGRHPGRGRIEESLRYRRPRRVHARRRGVPYLVCSLPWRIRQG